MSTIKEELKALKNTCNELFSTFVAGAIIAGGAIIIGYNSENYKEHHKTPQHQKTSLDTLINKNPNNSSKTYASHQFMQNYYRLNQLDRFDQENYHEY